MLHRWVRLVLHRWVRLVLHRWVRLVLHRWVRLVLHGQVRLVLHRRLGLVLHARLVFWSPVIAHDRPLLILTPVSQEERHQICAISRVPLNSAILVNYRLRKTGHTS
jgi:hypothetical protein